MDGLTVKLGAVRDKVLGGQNRRLGKPTRKVAKFAKSPAPN
jgi:hypothetical protein